ncbi:MAG: DNA translocase FtsK [Desulfobacteraceae bacterium]
MVKANVTECHLCQRCPRLLAYHLSGRKAAWTAGLKGNGFFPGNVFHNHIAKPFYQALSSKKPTKLKLDLIELLSKKNRNLTAGLHGLLQDHLLGPFLAEKAEKMKYEAVLSLGRGVELWARHLTEFLKEQITCDSTQGESLIAQIFCDPEKLITGSTRLKDGRTFQVSGKFDSLMVDQIRKEVILVEFKGLKPHFHDEELVQIGLYGWLIQQKTGIQPKGVVLYLDEKNSEVVYSAGEMAQMSSRLPELFKVVADVKASTHRKGKITLPPPFQPFLCDSCFLNGSCDRDWGPRRETEAKTAATKPSLHKKNEQSHNDHEQQDIEAEKLMTKVIEVFKVLKLPVEREGVILGPRLIRIKIKPAMEKGTTVKKIMNRAEDLQVSLSLDSPPLIQAHAGYIGLDIPRRIITPLTLEELLKRGADDRPDSAVAFPLGMGVDGSVFWADPTEPSMTSILVAGTSGSGKSIFLRAVVIAIAMTAEPDHVQFTLIDPKRVTFTDLTDLPHLRRPDITSEPQRHPIVMDMEEASAALEALVAEMEERYRQFTDHGVPDINAYHNLGHPLPHQVIVIDEYADLITDKTYKAQTETCIQRLCQKGRAAGYHIILSTQRPDSKVVTPLIKANLQLKVALKVTSATNSSIIIDEPGAERLIGKGDMLIGGALPVTRLQGALPTRTEIQKA